MRDTRLIMGMPITVEVLGAHAASEVFEAVFSYFISVDERFSTYKETSEISRINRGEISKNDYSEGMREVFALAEQTKKETRGYFDIQKPDGSLDPSGIVKGWAIQNAADMLQKKGFKDFYIDAGGDIASGGKNANGSAWSVGIRNPFNQTEVVKVLYPHGRGVATSGSYVRGAHIYNPHNPQEKLEDIVSITVISENVLEADRFATAAFAMGKEGISLIESLPVCEGYMIDAKGMATMTTGFERYTNP